MTTESELISLLTREYMYLQQTIESFDAKALHIKEWGTGIAVAIIAFSLQLRNRWITSLAAINALCFWIIELIWKLFQWAYMDRVLKIETYFRDLDAVKEIAPLQITHSWYSQWCGEDFLNMCPLTRDTFRIFIKKLFDFNVMLPYVIIIALVIALCYFWERLGLKRTE